MGWTIFAMPDAPGLEEIYALRKRLGAAIRTTPLMRCAGLEEFAGHNTAIHAKLEFLQHTGTFKARAALAGVHELGHRQLQVGITAVSAGNHAIATAYAAKAVGTSAKIAMLKTANAARIDACRRYGAELVLVDTVHEAFATAERIQKDEGRFLVHPFEGRAVATGTGLIGLEVHEQCTHFDAVVVAVGGGGLIGGIANTIKTLRPDCDVFGVEPEGADSMRRSLAAGKPCAIDAVATIADSLGAPYAMPYSFALCQQNVTDLVTVSDSEIRRAMSILLHTTKIAVEPACAASTAALLGPLQHRLKGREVVLIMCGSNIDWATFAVQTEPGYPHAA